ncbi:MAG: hypothetical protein RL669_510 [Pseudomonadota bacterium]
MKDFPLPVRGIGPGSQPTEGDEASTIDMPREVEVFAMPYVPDVADSAAARECRDVLARLARAMARWDPDETLGGPTLDLAGVSPAAIELVNQMMGEGEVGIRIADGRDVRIQESVFTGLWRLREFDAAGRLVRDTIEAAGVPTEALTVLRSHTTEEVGDVAIPEGAMNVAPIITELRAQMKSWRPGRPAHVINLTLLPVSPVDLQVIDSVLGSGAVAMISRGFGNCHVSATRLRNVWRVQYFNAMKTLILNTVVITQLPEEVIAAPEDIRDTRERFDELLTWVEEAWEL